MGYHHIRDLWIYNILFGLFQAPYYAYAQTMMSEVTPRGYENMFFGLFGITNRAVNILPLYLSIITNAQYSQVSLDRMSYKQSSTQQITTGWASHSYSPCVLQPVLSSGSWILRRGERTRKYVEERKLLRVAKEAGLTADQVIEGIARGDLGAESSSGSGSVEVFGIDSSKKGHID